VYSINRKGAAPYTLRPGGAEDGPSHMGTKDREVMLPDILKKQPLGLYSHLEKAAQTRSFP